MFSFDTEALNKNIQEFSGEDVDYLNQFTDQLQQKTNYGVQQLYILGKMLHLIYISI